jgi:hypothetical protein
MTMRDGAMTMSVIDAHYVATPAFELDATEPIHDVVAERSWRARWNCGPLFRRRLSGSDSLRTAYAAACG